MIDIDEKIIMCEKLLEGVDVIKEAETYDNEPYVNEYRYKAIYLILNKLGIDIYKPDEYCFGDDIEREVYAMLYRNIIDNLKSWCVIENICMGLVEIANDWMATRDIELCAGFSFLKKPNLNDDERELKEDIVFYFNQYYSDITFNDEMWEIVVVCLDSIMDEYSEEYYCINMFYNEYINELVDKKLVKYDLIEEVLRYIMLFYPYNAKPYWDQELSFGMFLFGESNYFSGRLDEVVLIWRFCIVLIYVDLCYRKHYKIEDDKVIVRRGINYR